MTQQPDTQPDQVTGPLSPGVATLVEAGWVNVQVPPARVPARGPVVLLGPGGVLVVGTHKSTDGDVADLASTVTALLPHQLRASVTAENGHDRQSLPQLAHARPVLLDGADVHAARLALAPLGAGAGLLLVQDFLDRTRNASGVPSRGDREPRAIRLANFVSRNAVALGIAIALIFLAVVLTTGTQDEASTDARAHHTASHQATGQQSEADPATTAPESSVPAAARGLDIMLGR